MVKVGDWVDVIDDEGDAHTLLNEGYEELLETSINYNDGNWHGWNGGECPVNPETMVECYGGKGVSGKVESRARFRSWSEVDAFRVIKEHREPREFWISNNDGFAHESLESALSDPLTEKHGYIHVREVKE